MNVRNIKPFPDVRDPVTGEWLPSSWSMEKAHLQSIEDERQTNRQVRNMANMMLSIFK